jgi:hypothetical protein
MKQDVLVLLVFGMVQMRLALLVFLNVLKMQLNYSAGKKLILKITVFSDVSPVALYTSEKLSACVVML